MKIKLKNVNDFRMLLMKKGLSARELARQADVSEPYTVKIVNGSQSPGAIIAKKLTDALGVEFDDIFFIDNASKSEQSKKVVN